MVAAAAIASVKLEVTTKDFVCAVLAATFAAGSSGYLREKVYFSPLTAALHVALKSSSVRASMKTSHTAESEREEVTFIEAAIIWKRATVTSVSLLPPSWVYRSVSCCFTSSISAEEISSMSPVSTRA